MKTKVFLVLFTIIVSVGFASAQRGCGNRGQQQQNSVNTTETNRGGCCNRWGDGERPCGYFVDENNDGICDLCLNQYCSNFVDENGDGLRDNCKNRYCGSFVDENNDGVCDRYNGSNMNQGNKMGMRDKAGNSMFSRMRRSR